MQPTSITEKYVRKPLFVDAVQVTSENFLDVARWSFGEIKNKDGSPVDFSKGPDPENQYIQVRVTNPKNSRQSKAYVGDWILYTMHGFKVYTTRAFHASFERVEEEEHSDFPFVAEEDVEAEEN